MDDELNRPQRQNKSYSEIFEELCPFYLSIGMSYAEYWSGPNDAPKHYRKAFKLRQENANHEAWLHGLYVYDAVTSAMSHLSKEKSSHKNYAEKPYSFTPKEIEKDNKEKVEEAQAQAEVWMKSWVSATQKMFKEK